jgi:uncharacterized metal-binding protein
MKRRDLPRRGFHDLSVNLGKPSLSVEILPIEIFWGGVCSFRESKVKERRLTLTSVKGFGGYPANIVGMNENVENGAFGYQTTKERPKATEAVRKKTVVYSCSGCSDAGELADLTARRLAKENAAEMSCLAGIGGRVKSLMLKAQRAEDILVIDGCPLNCARHTLELAGFEKFGHLELNKLGFKKGSCPLTEERIAIAREAAVKLIKGANEEVGDSDETVETVA